LDEWKKAFDTAVEKFQRVDVLLNIAGYVHPGDSFMPNQEHVDLHIDINTKV